MECLDEFSLGVGRQTMGKDIDYPLVTSPTTADQMAPLSDESQASFDVLQEIFVHLSPAVKYEQDPALSEFTSHSWDLLLGAPLHVMLPIPALRQLIQMLHRLDTEADFAADYHLPSLAASSQPLRLPDSRWELDTSIQTAMVKSSA